MELSRLSEQTKNIDSFEHEQFAIDVLTGLCSSPKQLSAKYFYDDAGSELFQKITQHQDYYPTRAEFEILQSIRSTLPQVFAQAEIDIIELGAGDGHKSLLVLEGFLQAGKRVNYYPIDISEKAMALLEQNIKAKDGLRIHGVVGEYFEGLKHVRSQSSNTLLVLFLGSNIGNFDRAQNQGFLRKLWKILNVGDHALIGFDLKKNIDRLTAAYNDSAGLTRAFNLNILNRINNELGADFKIDKFDHFGSYNPLLGAMESYLLSVEKQEVYIEELERSFHFDRYEPLHLEYSFKFLQSDIEFLACHTGYEVVEHYLDSQHLFTDSLWKVKKRPVK